MHAPDADRPHLRSRAAGSENEATPLVRFHPRTGRLWFATGARRVAIADPYGTDPPAAAFPPGRLRDLSFDRDGEQVVLAWDDRRLEARDARTGAARRVELANPGNVAATRRVQPGRPGVRRVGAEAAEIDPGGHTTDPPP